MVYGALSGCGRYWQLDFICMILRTFPNTLTWYKLPDLALYILALRRRRFAFRKVNKQNPKEWFTHNRIDLLTLSGFVYILTVNFR